MNNSLNGLHMLCISDVIVILFCHFVDWLRCVIELLSCWDFVTEMEEIAILYWWIDCYLQGKLA